LRILFQTKNLSEVKNYLCSQWTKICTGEIEFKDFIFAKEVKMKNYTNLPKGVILADRMKNSDPGFIMKDGERIQYLIVNGQDGLKSKKT
jgi:DNA polymerase zeta